jgi:hypothetical protein
MRTTVVVLLVMILAIVQQAASDKTPTVKLDTSKSIKILTPPYKRPNAIIPTGSGAKGTVKLVGPDNGAPHLKLTGPGGKGPIVTVPRPGSAPEKYPINFRPGGSEIKMIPGADGKAPVVQLSHEKPAVVEIPGHSGPYGSVRLVDERGKAPTVKVEGPDGKNPHPIVKYKGNA